MYLGTRKEKKKKKGWARKLFVIVLNQINLYKYKTCLETKKKKGNI